MERRNRDHFDRRQVSGGQVELVRRRRLHNEHAPILRVPSRLPLVQAAEHRSRGGPLEAEVLEDAQPPFARGERKRRAERPTLHATRQPVAVIARLRPEYGPATPPQRGAAASNARVAGALLAPRLAAAARNERPVLRGVGSGPPSGHVLAHGVVVKRRFHRRREDGRIEFHLTAFGTLDDHGCGAPPRILSLGYAFRRKRLLLCHGHSRCSCWFRFPGQDLRISTVPPRGPGTAPRTATTFSSASTRTIRRLRTVTRSRPC